MADFTWYLQGTAPTEIIDTDKLQFAAGTFDSKITVDEYQDSMHVKDIANDDKSAANAPKNNKYLTISTVSINGGAPTNLVDISTANCALKINFANDPAVITEDAIFYAYDGATLTDPPENVIFQAAERGDANWTEAGGSGAAVALDDQGSNTSHDFFIPVSAKPTTVGAKTGKVRIELTYS